MERKELLKRLNEINSTQTDKCNATSRYIVYAIFGANFTLFLRKGEDCNMLVIITCIFSVIYLSCEILHYYMSAHNARKLHDEVNYNSCSQADADHYNSIVDKMNKTSGISFIIMQVKLILLVLIVILQLFYFLARF